MSPRMTKNSLIRLTRTPISKPVTSTESIVMATKITAANGARDLGLETCFPLGRVSNLGGKILSYILILMPVPPAFPDRWSPAPPDPPDWPGHRKRSPRLGYQLPGWRTGEPTPHGGC